MSVYFKVKCNKAPLSYTVNEPIIMTLSVYNNKEKGECRRFKWEIQQDDGKQLSGEGQCLAGREFTLETSLSRPGFVYLTVTPLNTDGSTDPKIDPLYAGAGADVDKIHYHGNIPEDFDEYWQGIEKLVADFTPELVQKVPHYADVPDWCDCYDIKISTPIGCWASGYLSVPKKEGKYPLEVNFRGYAIVGALPDFKKDRIFLNVSAHPIENGFSPEALASKYPQLQGYGFNNEENKKPETSYWHNMMIRDLIAVKWAKTLEGWDGKVLIASGGSQAAFQATTVAAHDKDVTLLDIYIPWFCDLNLEKNGYLKSWRPEPQPGLEYFDTVAQAMRVKCPVQIMACLGDYTCSPASIMSLYNNISARKKLTFLQGGTHGYRPPERDCVYLYTDEEISGRYRHYKGNEYEVLGIGKDSESLMDVVIYKSLDDGKIWSRPKHMWSDQVIYRNGQFKRFEKI